MHTQLIMTMICQRLWEKFNGDKEEARKWLNTPLQELNNYSPYQCIDTGNVMHVLSILS